MGRFWGCFSGGRKQSGSFEVVTEEDAKVTDVCEGRQSGVVNVQAVSYGWF